MSYISIEGPRIKDLNVKRTLVREVTEAAKKAYHMPAHYIVVVIKEDEPENVSVGGQLICDRNKGS